MNAIPFVYFSLISLLLYKKRKKFDIAIIIAMIFAVSGFFSILIDIFHLRYREAIGYQFSVGASFAYCALLTMCLLPFAVNTHLSANNLKPLRKGHMLKTFAWIAIIWFIITAIFS